VNRSNGDGGNYYAQIPEAVLYGPVSALAVRVYGCLDRHADDRGRCWPSLEKTLRLLG
jgi:hypothetical protein